jgi:hypothetical protein
MEKIRDAWSNIESAVKSAVSDPASRKKIADSFMDDLVEFETNRLMKTQN